MNRDSLILSVVVQTASLLVEEIVLFHFSRYLKHG